MRGPIDYLIVGFNGVNFDGSVLKSLEEPIKNGVINLIALAAVAKDQDGNLTVLDVVGTGDEYLVEFSQQFAVDSKGISQEDIDEVGGLLEPDEAAGLLVIEQLWAKPLKQALLNANGFLIAEGRIHPEAADELNESEV